MPNHHIHELQKLIENGLTQIDLPTTPTKLYEPIRYILSLGGKRVRPVLCLLGAELFNGNATDALSQALAVEVFHNFTLVHDDIMDRADVRRGTPTVHKKWDDNVAILSGDGMLVKAYQLLADAPVNKLPDLFNIFSRTALEVCEGQQMDMDLAHAESVTMEEYVEMIRLKTAVLLTCAMQAGALINDANTEDLERIKSFTENIGLAFQVRDDYLDAFGDHASFGKEIGGDIKEGKRTWLTVKSLEIEADRERSEVLKAYAIENKEARVAAVLSLYEKLGIQTKAEEAIQEFSDKGMQSLDAIEGNPEAKKTLKTLVHLLMNRSN